MVKHQVSYWAFKWASFSSISASSVRSDSSSTADSSTCQLHHSSSQKHGNITKTNWGTAKTTQPTFSSPSVLELHGLRLNKFNFNMCAAVLNVLRLQVWDLSYTRSSKVNKINTSLNLHNLSMWNRWNQPQVIIGSWTWNRWSYVLSRVNTGWGCCKMIWNNLYLPKPIIHEAEFDF